MLNAESLLEPFRDSLPPNSRARLTVIPNGVPTRARTVSSAETRTAARAAARAMFGIPPDVFAVGTLARLVRQKRIDRLLDAVARLPHVHAIIAGDGARGADLRAQADLLGIADRVHFLGQCDNASAVLAALDVFVVASDQEGMSNAMLEALAAGVPVVSTAVSGAREALTQTPVCGIVVDPTADAIAAGVMTLMESEELRTNMARAAIRVAEDRYGSERMTDAWEALLTAEAGPEA